ncbi:MAG TPA: tagaturonate reductase [Flavisolibacter sp.]|jgi:tagaturonate reductase|nr:tagaturonate reductase [Flavisolibacter sp.]
MKLSRYTVKNITAPISVPDDALFELPEKVLQFGTGVLLRGLPDYFIDKANKQGLFNGRIVVVKSTAQGDSSLFDKQDGLYTICVRGKEQGRTVEETIVNASISRVLSATDEWEQILECAHNREMQVIISNTTEVGIQLVPDDIRHHPPKSFPGKLLSFLYERFRAFGGSAHSGMVIIPTELIPDNGRKLESIVLELAHLNGLEESFIEWVEQHNCFCNSLVDRIVPGKPDAAQLKEIENAAGYTDGLVIIAEVYRLWAIEGNEELRSVLSFAGADPGVVIAPDIESYRELKLRLLNGTHTLSCGLAFLSGLETVKAGMEDQRLSAYMATLMQREIGPSIPYTMEAALIQEFSKNVLDRFRNPYLRHLWLNICMQYSSKLKLRCVPLLRRYYELHNQVPELIALGFAAYILFMKAITCKGAQYFGEHNGVPYLIQDDQAAVFFARWQGRDAAGVVKATLSDTPFWGEDLTLYRGFEKEVTSQLESLMQGDTGELIECTLNKKEVAA